MQAIALGKFDAVLFDLDGVITGTAKIQASACRHALDEFLKKRSGNEPFKPFEKQSEYEDYADGKSRYEGAQGFLGSRHIEVTRGIPSDPPDKEIVCGIANRQNELFERGLKKESVDVFECMLVWIRHLRQAGLKVAVVWSSNRCEANRSSQSRMLVP